MSRAPSLKRLEEAFPGKGKELRALLKGKTKTRSYQSVKDLVAGCYNPPDYPHRLMTALNEILEGHGVECLWRRGHSPNDCTNLPLAEYVNMGDTYTTTLIRKVETGTILIACWGDFAESNRL